MQTYANICKLYTKYMQKIRKQYEQKINKK